MTSRKFRMDVAFPGLFHFIDLKPCLKKLVQRLHSRSSTIIGIPFACKWFYLELGVFLFPFIVYFFMWPSASFLAAV